MGPHFFKCGKETEEGMGGSEEGRLQWGRTFSSAERQGRWKGQDKPAPLQWGRTFSSAERGSKVQPQVNRKTASMGPHFFKCGKV